MDNLKRKSLGRTALAGIGWLLAQNVGSRLVGFTSQILLARILAPTDFASLGLAGTVAAVVGVLTNFGVDDVLLQRQQTIRFWATPALLISLTLGLGSMALILVAAPLAAMIYKDPILPYLLAFMAVSMPIGALGTVPWVKIRGALNFRFLAVYSSIELIVTQASMITLATLGFGPYSFVIPIPLMTALRVVVFWCVGKPSFKQLKPRQLRLMGANGAAVFGTKVLAALIGQGDYFVLGLLAPKPIVGAYFFAYRLSIQPVQMMAGSLNNVLFPLLAQLCEEPSRQRMAALSASRVLAFAIMPLCFFQAALTPSLIPLVFGTKWNAAIPLVQILSIGLAFDAVSWIAGSLLSARGEFRRAFTYSCVFSPVFFLLVAIGGLLYSATGVAIGVSIFYITLAPIFSYIVFSRVGASVGEVSKIYASSTVFAAGSALGAMIFAHFAFGTALVRICAILFIGGGLYLACARICTPESYREVLTRVLAIVRSKRSGAGADST